MDKIGVIGMVKKYVRKSGLSLFLGTVPFLLFFIFCFSSPVKAEKGLAGWWKFDEGVSDILHDSSGNKKHGKINGATWVKGKTGYALLFDGKDDFVYCGNDSSLHLDGSLTISTWVNVPIGLSYRDYIIINKNCWVLEIKGKQNDPNIIANIVVETRSEDDYWHMSTSRDCPTYQWVYIVVMYSLEEKNIKLYINGALVYNMPLDISFAYDSCPLFFGMRTGHSYFYGLISETKIYSRDLSEEEIKKNYSSELETKDESLSERFLLGWKE